MMFLSRLKLLWRLSGLLEITKPGKESLNRTGVHIIIQPGLVLPVKYINFNVHKAAPTKRFKKTPNIEFDVPEEFLNEPEEF